MMDDGAHDFGFAAGIPPEAPPQKSNPSSNSELENVLSAVAILTDWRKRSPFRCSAHVMFGNSDSEEFAVLAQPVELSYEVGNTKTGFVESFDPQTGMIRSGNEERYREVNQIITEPMAVRLAFPLSLGIWGRPGDSYRINGGSRKGTRTITLNLVHQKRRGTRR